MATILDDFVGIGLFYGLEIVALLILIGSAVIPRVPVVIIILGVVAAGCMAVESAMWWVMANMNGAEPTSSTNLTIVSAISILSLLIYFPLAITRCRAHRRRLAAVTPLPAGAPPL
jgi:ABC-type Fe3+-siderophore transport system permease subunit